MAREARVARATRWRGQRGQWCVHTLADAVELGREGLVLDSTEVAQWRLGRGLFDDLVCEGSALQGRLARHVGDEDGVQVKLLDALAHRRWRSVRGGQAEVGARAAATGTAAWRIAQILLVGIWARVLAAEEGLERLVRLARMPARRAHPESVSICRPTRSRRRDSSEVRWVVVEVPRRRGLAVLRNDGASDTAHRLLVDAVDAGARHHGNAMCALRCCCCLGAPDRECWALLQP